MKEIINYKNFDEKKMELLKKKFINNKPFPHMVIDNFFDKKFLNKIIKCYKINDNWINYSFVNNFKKFGLNDRSKMNHDLNLLFNNLASKKFVNKLIKITKIEKLFLDKDLDGGGLHQIFKNGYLNIHTDFASHTTKHNWKRVLNILIYANKSWKKKYNGNLELWNSTGKKKITEIFPKFNRCVIFLTNDISFHGHPKKLKCPSNLSRKSIAAYYFIDKKKKLKLRPTNYIPRPSDSFKDKFLINFDKQLNNFYSILKRRKILNDKIITKILNNLPK